MTSLYNDDGAILTTVVTGSAYTGLYSPDGSWNIVINNGSVLTGRYHSCGALNAVIVTDPSAPAMAANGSINVYSNNSGGYSPVHNFGCIPVWVVNRANPPDIAIDWANNRAWKKAGGVFTPSSLITVTRASSAYVNDNAGNWTLIGNNLPRLSNLGLLTEEARTNLFLQSAVPATQTITVVSGSTYSVSVIGTGSLTLSGALTGTVTQGSPVIGAASTTSLTVTTAGITGAFVNVNVELGSTVTSPIRTTVAAVTRSGDAVTLTTPPAFGSAYSLYGKGKPQAPVASASIQFNIQIDDGTNTNRTFIRREPTSGNATYRAIGGSTFIISGLPQAANVSTKIAGAAIAADQAAYANGALISATSGAVLPSTPTTVRFGSEATGTSQFNGFLEYNAIWASQRVPNAQLQSITQ